MSRIQTADGFPFTVCQFEIIKGEIASYAFRLGGLRNDDNAFVRQEFQADLGDVLAVPVGNLFQRFIAEKIVHASCQRAPCHEAGAVFLHQLTHLYLLGKNVRLQLYYGRLYFHIFSQVHETGIVEIAQSDSTRLSCLEHAPFLPCMPFPWHDKFRSNHQMAGG